MSNCATFDCVSLDQVPCGALAMDAQGAICAVNSILADMLAVAPETLIGKSEGTIELHEHTGLFKGAGLMRLAASEPEQERWLQCFVSQSETDEQITLKYFQDVTELIQLRDENERLRHQVQELAITDELTGLANRRALTSSLNAQVTRSRRYHNPLCLAALELMDDKGVASEINDETILATSRYLRDRLRWVDIIGRWDHNQFFIILPETAVQEGRMLLDKMTDDYPAAGGSESLRLHYGLAEWTKGYDARKLMQLAVEAMQQSVTS